MAARILPLPEEVRTQLRSGVAIASVAQCVEELVLNSLDAGATCVAVRVDLPIFRIQVVDNGQGVLQTDLKYLGKRHATSKCHSLKDLNTNLCHYGFRGEALASIINLSAIVDITTRPQGTPRTLTKLFTFGKERSVSAAKINRPSVGTTVTIQEFMYNMPVRQKLVREAIDVESVRMRLESFALMHPKVAFSLRNDRTNAMVIQTKKSSGILATFLQLFGVERAQGMAEVHHTVGHFTVSGYIGTQPHLTKALQFVYINKRIFLKTKIHRLLNDLLARSSVISARLHPSSVGPTRTSSSPPKGMRLYGMFVLNIECPYTEYDICLDPAKTLVEFKDWNQILLCIEELVIQFVNEENLVISLDERFRRSGKEQEGEEEQEENLSQSSQSRLQVFSLKRSCEGSKEDEGPGPAKQRYGRTLNTQDNLLAIHSAMVKRVRKEDKGRKGDTDDNDNNKETTQHTTDKKDDNTDTPDKDDDLISDTMKMKVKKKNNEDNIEETTLPIHQKDMQGDTTRCIDATPESIDKKQQNHNYSVSHSLTNLNKLNDTEKNNSGNEHITESSGSEENVYAKRKKGVWSVLDEFKKVLEEINERDDTTESDLDQTITTTQSSNTQQEEDSGRNRKTGDSNKDRVKSNPSTLTTLEEFMNANNREEGNSFIDEYKTPEGDVRGTPITPPPLKSHRPSSPTPSVGKDEPYTRRIQQGSTPPERKCSCDTKKTKTNERHIERRVTRHSNKVSLSQSLSEKLKTRQNMSRSIPSLQRFGYCKTNTNTTQNVQQTQGNIMCGERERSSVINKTRSSIEGSGECPRVNTHTKTTEDKGGGRTGKCHEGFKFDPVITKTFQGVDTCLAHMQSCGDSEPSINIPLDNNNTIDAQYRTVEKINHKPIVSSSEIEKCVDVSSGNRVSILNQLSTPPRQTNSLLHIAQNYASTPEDSDGSPEKPNTSNTILKVPPFQGFEDNLTHPQTTSSRFPSETCDVVNSSDKCAGFEGVNVTGRRSEGGSTYVESEGSTLVKELIIDTDTLLQTDAVNIFLTKSNSYSDKTLSVCEKEDSMQPVEKGETQFKVSQNIDPGIALYNAPVTQSFELIDTITQREDHRKREEVEEDLQEYVCRLQPSQGFKPSSIEPPRIQRMDASIENKLSVLTCPQHIQETTDSVRVCSGDVKTQETTIEEGIEMMSGSKVLESLSQLSEREIHFENTLPLVSQMNMENRLTSICKPPAPDASLTLETQPLPQPLPPQEGVVSEVEEKGSQPPSQTSTDPFSDSLHFSQLTLPDEVGSAASLGAGACASLDTLPTSTTLSVAFPFTYQSSVCGNSDPQRNKMSSCDTTFGNMKGSEEGSVETLTSYSTDCDVGTIPSIPDTIQASHTTTNAILEPMQTLPLPSLPPVQSVDGSATITKICHDPALHKDTKSCEESNEPKGVGSITNQGLNNGIKPSCQNTAGQTEVTACETPLDPQKYRWREAKDKEGRTVYVDLQTGNSSYEPPEVKDGPEWTSSQPLGAPLPKLPLTHEPWYIPRGIHKDRDSFTLSHGFTELVSWKKTIQMRKENVGQESTVGNTNSTPAGMPQEVKVALESALEDSEADNNFVKWTEKPDDLQEPVQPSDVAQICQMWEPPDFAMDGEVLNSGLDAGAGGRGGSGVRVYNMVHPYRFTQDMLHSCKVLGQLDQKFIACSLTYPNPKGASSPASQLVVLFDQHAVHERVRLEAIIRGNCETLESGETVLCKSAVIPPLELNLPEDEVRLMQAYSEKFNQRGLYFTRASPSKVLFQLIPSCLVPKEANEVRQKRCQTAGAIVESVVRDVCYTLHQTGGVLGFIPRPISHVFNNNACRGAIKFGDALTHKECRNLITSLLSCQLPFQCAHGRPSVVPVVNLTHLASRIPKRTNKPNLKKLRDAMMEGGDL